MAPIDRGYFNDADYGQSLLRQARLGLSVELAAGERLAVLAEARAENMENPRLYALYLRVRPLAGRRVRRAGGPDPAGVRTLRARAATARTTRSSATRSPTST